MNNLKIIFSISFFCSLIVASEHNHTDKHPAQWNRMYKLLNILDIEQEKLKLGSDEILRKDLGASSVFDKYISIQACKDLPPDFRGIFKAMNRLAGSIVCPICKDSFIQLIEMNRKKIKEKQQKLEVGQSNKGVNN